MNIRRLKKIYIYTRFERFWHWVQAFLIIMLMITGLEIHGVYTLFGFKTAVAMHNFMGISWLILFAFIIFWVLTTGEWRQYIPTTKKLFDVVIYYSYGIFKGKPHPVQKSPGAKHNPLQRLTYLGVSVALLPIQMAVGLLYYSYNKWLGWGLSGYLDLGVIATIHVIITFLLLAFLIGHIYMTTTGHRISSHIWAMITGWEEVYETTKIYEWETAEKRK